MNTNGQQADQRFEPHTRAVMAGFRAIATHLSLLLFRMNARLTIHTSIDDARVVRVYNYDSLLTTTIPITMGT